MFSKFVDILTVIAMIIVLIVLLVEFTPVYQAVASIFSVNAYGF